MNFLDSRLPERFWEKCIPEPNSGCWLWVGAAGGCVIGRQTGTYGRMWTGFRTEPSHRIAYAAKHGAIGKGLCIDHLCRNTLCCNPAHLEAVTTAENTRRGDMGKARGAIRNSQKRRTHCPAGHAYSEHGRISADGKRSCRTCASMRARIKHKEQHA